MKPPPPPPPAETARTSESSGVVRKEQKVETQEAKASESGKPKSVEKFDAVD